METTYQYFLRVNGLDIDLSASSVAEAKAKARAKIREGIDASDLDSTVWETGHLFVRSIDDDDDDEQHLATLTVAVDPMEPPCVGIDEEHESRAPTSGSNHRWKTPHRIVGGCEENPGVQGHGGGIVTTEVCTRCGCQRLTDSWATNPVSGEQGLLSVAYTAGQFADEI